MDTKEEIKYYCNELHPVGALMVTGEWGIGKTYLIENDVKEDLKGTHILVRISLFGISTVEELKKEVQSRWIQECHPMLKFSDNTASKNLTKTIKSTVGKEIGEMLPFGKNVAQAVFSVNPIDFIQIKPRVSSVDGEKRVILVFDDLERSKLDTIALLGCINEYCENNKFLVIIIANEDKVTKQAEKIMSSDGTSQGISYREIKEKIVCRTVIYTPDYANIIASIINSKDNGFGVEYLGVLKKFRVKIINLLELASDVEENDPDNSEASIIKKAPRNLRSLKCALHDFERIYKILKEERMDDNEIRDNLLAFIAYTLVAKADLLDNTDISVDELEDDNIRRFFPFLNTRSIFQSEVDWIINCVWNEEFLRNEINERKELVEKQRQAQEPKEKLKVNNLNSLDDDIVKTGFYPLLEEVYNGQLSLDEYVQFIYNMMIMRIYDFQEYKSIEWEKVNAGIEKVINQVKSNGDYSDVIKQNTTIDSPLEDAVKKKFNSFELEAYELISHFFSDNLMGYETNRMEFINNIEEYGFRAFELATHKVFDRFDVDMADATASCYESASQQERNNFSYYFCGLWGNLNQDMQFQKNATIAGLECLEKLLDDLKCKFEQGGKRIASVNIEKFIQDVVRLKQKYSEDGR